ncbi:MAG: energy-coupling factor transporter transmembrane component T [Anaerolineales bacterium]|nr:energy-coupling factor transporter transmembrane component T [Anaerolineales bacterium]
MSRFELYVAGDSWLHRSDARVKLLFVAGALSMALIYQSLWFTLASLLVLAGLHWSARVPSSRITSAIVALAPVSLLMFALRTIFYPAGATLFRLGPVVVTSAGAAQGAVVGLRLIVMALIVLLWLYTTRDRELVRSFLALGLPYSWGLAFSLALRFLPTFATTFTSISRTQQARALDLGSGGRIERLKKRIPIFVPMLISVFRDSEQMAIALEARGFGAQAKRTDLHPLEFKRTDVVLALSILLILLLLSWLRIGVGFGAEPLELLV